MAKEKTKKGAPNKHLTARIAFLQRASVHLTHQAHLHSTRGNKQTRTSTSDRGQPTSKSGNPDGTSQAIREPHGARQRGHIAFTPSAVGGLPHLLSSHLAQVARKSQIRLPPDVKHQFCGRCNAALVEERTCRRYVANTSKGGRKPQADVLVIECDACHALKRRPVGAHRQLKKKNRPSKPV